jgi:hypothetical protein
MEGWGLTGWVIGGSTAQWAHGLPVTPGDVDVRCSEADLDRIEKALGTSCRVEETNAYRVRTCHTSIGGWDVEFSGDLLFDDGSRIAVDETVCARRADAGVQSIEDVIVELIGMGRGFPRDDRSRARQLTRLRPGDLDHEYLVRRLAAIGRTDPEIFASPK